MRLADSVHRSHRWLIDELAPDFDLLDVWAMPVTGGRDDFGEVIGVLASLDPTASPSALSRFLFWLRLRVGALLGWDDAAERRPVPDASEATLAARLPDDLRDSADEGFSIGGAGARVAGGFRPVYRTATEAAAEISNATVHGVLHLSWVPHGRDRYRAHMAVYVKPRGMRGRAYLRLIGPFRHAIVYPALMRQIGALWDARQVPAGPEPGTAPTAPA